jgi:hypothetical protein
VEGGEFRVCIQGLLGQVKREEQVNISYILKMKTYSFTYQKRDLYKDVFLDKLLMSLLWDIVSHLFIFEISKGKVVIV